MTTFRAYDRIEGIANLSDVWKLQKGSRTVVCELFTHPFGHELRITLDGELAISQVCRTESDVLDTLERWRGEWRAKGWTEEL